MSAPTSDHAIDSGKVLSALLNGFDGPMTVEQVHGKMLAIGWIDGSVDTAAVKNALDTLCEQGHVVCSGDRYEMSAATFASLLGADEDDEAEDEAAVTADSRHMTASAVVIDPIADRVLLERHKFTGFLQFPGGHVDPDEAPHEAAVREVLEETGVDATLWNPLAEPIPGSVRHPVPLMVCEFPAPADPDPAWNEPEHHHIDLLYLATADSTAPTVGQPEEVDEVVWVPLAELSTTLGVRPEVPMVARFARTQLA